MEKRVLIFRTVKLNPNYHIIVTMCKSILLQFIEENTEGGKIVVRFATLLHNTINK
jgi:hypothetical protein